MAFMATMLGRARCRSAGETLSDFRQRAGAVPVAGRGGRCDARWMCGETVPDRQTLSDRLWIEIDSVAEPISGVVHHGSEPVRRFCGWLELVALLETRRREGERRSAPPEPG